MAETQKKAAAARPQHDSVQGSEPNGPEAGKNDEKVADTAQEAVRKTRTAEPAGSGDQGPGTKQVAPDADPVQRSQARMHIGAAHAAAPIEAPDAAKQTDPPEGLSRSSHNPVAATVGINTYAGENHVRYVDADGNDIEAGSMFEDANENQTYRVVKQRIYEEFNYQGSRQPMTRLLFPAGHRVDLVTASRMEHAHQLGTAQLQQEKERFDAEQQEFYGG